MRLSPQTTVDMLLLCCLSGLALAGCDDDLPKATNIESMRILGSRVDIVRTLDGDVDETRSTPYPGERVRVEFATVFPTQDRYPTLDGETPGTQALLVSCTAPERFTGGLPVCQEFLDVVSEGIDVAAALDVAPDVERFTCEENPGEGAQTFPLGLRRATAAGVTVQCVDGPFQDAEFELPEDFQGDNALLLGVVCEKGHALIDFTHDTLFRCTEGEGIQVHAVIPVARAAEDENHHPDLSKLEILFNDRPWPFSGDPPIGPPDQNCRDVVGDDDDSVLIADPLENTIEIRYPADPPAREEMADGEPETLEFTVYSTLPELERRFTIFTPDSDIVELDDDGDTRRLLSAELTWDGPMPDQGDEWFERDTDGELILVDGERVPLHSRLAFFFFTALDRRGGFDITSRALCVRFHQ